MRIAVLKELFTIEADFDFDQEKQIFGLNLLLTSDKDCILVAQLLNDDRVLGMCTLQTLISTAEGGRSDCLKI